MREPDEARQLILDVVPEPSYAPERFIVSDGNRLAYEHVLAFPDWPVPICVICGPAKSGKTHLAEIWLKHGRGVRAGPGDVEGLAGTADLAPVLLDDVDRAGYGETGLFNLLNRSIRDGIPVLMTARRDISNWPFATDDVKSRARLGAFFSVAAADDLQLSQMFAKLFSDRQVVVDPSVIAYLVPRMHRSPSEVYELAALMDRMALQQGRAITRKVAADALAMRAHVHEIGGSEQHDGPYVRPGETGRNS